MDLQWIHHRSPWIHHGSTVGSPWMYSVDKLWIYRGFTINLPWIHGGIHGPFDFRNKPIDFDAGNLGLKKKENQRN